MLEFEQQTWIPDDHIRFCVEGSGDLCVFTQLNSSDPNLCRCYRINRENARVLAKYLREVE